MTDYVKDLKIENPRHPFRTDAERLSIKLREDTILENGVLRWKSNGAVPFGDAIALAAHVGIAVDIQACKEARELDDEIFIKAYRQNYKGPSDEEMAEARAAHGPGVELVDVISGHRYMT